MTPRWPASRLGVRWKLRLYPVELGA